MAHAVILVSDTHTGSRYGLWPEGATDDEGAKPELNKYQTYLWDCWQHAWQDWLPATIGNLPRIVVHAGDSIEGNHNGLGGLVCLELATQVMAADALLKPYMRAPCYMVSGTEAHAGQSAQWDNAVAVTLGAKTDDTGRGARWELWLTVDGVRFHVAHHMRGGSALISELTPLVAERNDMAQPAALKGHPMPQVIVRGHMHWYRTFTDDDGHTVIALPGWTARSPYVFKRSRLPARPPGLVVVITDNAQHEVYAKTYKWPAPVAEEIESCDPTPSLDSHSASGKRRGSLLSRMLAATKR